MEHSSARLTPLTPVPPPVVRSVLLIEDSEPDAVLVRACLKRWDGEVSLEWVDTIQAGIARLESREEFDVVLLDLHLPGSSGLESLDAILPRATTTPVVVLTGTDDERLAAAALRAGAQDYLLKDDLTPQYLGRTLRHAIDRARMVQELQQAEKMRTLGQFAAGVAHDLNNVFTVVLGGMDEIGAGLPGTSPLQQEVPVVLDAVRRGAHLVRQILSFSRRDRLTPAPFDLGGLVRSQEAFLQRLGRPGDGRGNNGAPGIELVVLDADEVTAWGDASAMMQILSNLVSNAWHATRAGRIEVEAHEEVRDDARWAVLTVRDTGSGMSDEVRGRIFEPFYSTRERGSGTGLGLATVHGMVEQQNGMIEVESEVGVGTTFRVLLPSTGPREPDAEVGHGPAPGSGRTILLVEDEAGIRRAGTRGLERAGYTVLQAADGREGIERYRAHRDQIGLVVSDVMMPVLNGRAMIDRLKEIDPGLRYLFTSGYTGVDLTRRDLLAPGEPLLAKPWSIDELLAEVEQRLPLGSGQASG